MENKVNKSKMITTVMLAVIIVVAIGWALIAKTSIFWKTYSNSKYGFELKTPTDWKVGDEAPIQFTDNANSDATNIGMINIDFTAKNKGETINTFDVVIIPTKNIATCNNTPLCNIGTKIGENNGFTIGYLDGTAINSGYTQEEYDKFVKSNVQNNDKVISSFKFTK